MVQKNNPKDSEIGPEALGFLIRIFKMKSSL